MKTLKDVYQDYLNGVISLDTCEELFSKYLGYLVTDGMKVYIEDNEVLMNIKGEFYMQLTDGISERSTALGMYLYSEKIRGMLDRMIVE